MRAIGMSDLDAATRAVLAVPPYRQAAFAARLIEDAHSADVSRKRTGRAHPNGGTGSLCAQAACHPRTCEAAGTPAYCAALSVVLSALGQWRARLDRRR